MLYPQRAFPYLGLGLVEVDRANYRNASLLFRRAVEVAPGSALARAWLGVCQVFEGHYALGARTLMTRGGRRRAWREFDGAAFLNLPECAPYRHAARAAHAAPRRGFPFNH